MNKEIFEKFNGKYQTEKRQILQELESRCIGTVGSANSENYLKIAMTVSSNLSRYIGMATREYQDKRGITKTAVSRRNGV